jgi:acyl-homoserine-lactone acylase
MRRLLLVLALTCLPALAARTPSGDLARWRQRAARVTIIRDTWGIPHVYGKTDADTVFGLIYAQAEDDFPRVETNYLNALGRLAEVEGPRELARDLRMRLFIDPADLKAKYAASPAWLKALMAAWADGLNFYLHERPAVRPRLLTRFEPWMALSFTEGSIGGDIESIRLTPLARFYGHRADTHMPPEALPDPSGEPSGSNGFALAPSVTASGHALLLINPHTSFYFRPEVHAVSGEGLNAYGAVTWGQFFVYQGFNERLGWMHTSGGADVIDEWLETIVRKGGRAYYRYGDTLRPFRTKRITLKYRDGSQMKEATVTAYFSHRGPVVREADGRWVSLRLMQDPVHALMQSYLRTKARTFAGFRKVLDLRTNSSNNTVYADADGNIALFYGNFVPRRDPRFDFTKPVDGSNPATDWKGLHPVREAIQVVNPKHGWIQNTNNWPFSAAGPDSPRQSDYPAYMWSQPENPRGLHAVKVLQGRTGVTLDGLIAAAYDSELTAFADLLPALFQAYDAAPEGDPLRARLAEPVALLRAWDLRSGLDSVPTSLAIAWGQDLMARCAAPARAKGVSVYDFMARDTAPVERLQSLIRALEMLQKDFGTWKTPWGEINRFQRLSGAIDLAYDDAKPSLPVPFASSTWGSLAAFGPATATGTRRIYGNRGNSFVAVVAFGPRIQAKSLLAGGESGDPASPHFADQAERYAKGQFKEVWFYREAVEAHARRTYHPGR